MIDWIFFRNLYDVVRMLFSGRIYINPDFIVEKHREIKISQLLVPIPSPP